MMSGSELSPGHSGRFVLHIRRGIRRKFECTCTSHTKMPRLWIEPTIVSPNFARLWVKLTIHERLAHEPRNYYSPSRAIRTRNRWMCVKFLRHHGAA